MTRFTPAEAILYADELDSEKPHEWGPITVGHGSAQCKKCLCTFEEAKYALGMKCRNAKPNKAAEMIRFFVAEYGKCHLDLEHWRQEVGKLKSKEK